VDLRLAFPSSPTSNGPLMGYCDGDMTYDAYIKEHHLVALLSALFSSPTTIVHLMGDWEDDNMTLDACRKEQYRLDLLLALSSSTTSIGFQGSQVDISWFF
jgi:hypothetical protein